jgi:hypothetical protein
LNLKKNKEVETKDDNKELGAECDTDKCEHNVKENNTEESDQKLIADDNSKEQRVGDRESIQKYLCNTMFPKSV